MPEALLWAPRAWVGGRWRDAVLLRADTSGHWAEVRPDSGSAPPQAIVLDGAVLPGLVNAHSHAFQRAFAGLAERREHDADDFWSWRDRMYGLALRITPEQLRAVAAQLQLELLRGGYTQVCEFHYLHHAPDGAPYDEPLAMSHALSDAARRTGIGLTLLPVLYERSGFAATGLRADQRRFATTPLWVLEAHRALRTDLPATQRAGIAIHSLRAASAASISALLEGIGDDDVPVHVHVAEQTAEVDDCLAATGMRPIEWLCRQQRIDRRWQLVHATHATPAEIDAVAASGAAVVICPTTEANLGDGLCDLPRWLDAQVPLAIGSDSHVCRHWREELCWLEYGQRLALRRRNVAAAPARGESASAARLWNAALHGSARAAGLPCWGLEAGARADLLVLDERADGLRGVPASHLLDALVFACDASPWREVWVAGRRVLHVGRHADDEGIAAHHAAAMAALASTPVGA